MKKLLLLLLCVPLIGYTNDKESFEKDEYYIGDVEIFENEGYIQINQDSSKIYFIDRNPPIVVYDTSENRQRILEYKYKHYPHGDKAWEKREWYTNGILKYESIRHDVKLSNSYISETKYSDKGDLISERKLKLNGEEAGWWYLNGGFLMILYLIISILVLLFSFALYRIIRLLIFKNHRSLSFLLTLLIVIILYYLTFLIAFVFYFVLILWIILGLKRVFNKKKYINKK